MVIVSTSCDSSSSLYSGEFSFVPRELRLPRGWRNAQPRAVCESLGTSLAIIIDVFVDSGEIIDQSQKIDTTYDKTPAEEFSIEIGNSNNRLKFDPDKTSKIFHKR